MSDKSIDDILNAPFCFWIGLPPCPKCRQNHGDKQCDTETDKLFRQLVEYSTRLATATELVKRAKEAVGCHICADTIKCKRHGDIVADLSAFLEGCR